MRWQHDETGRICEAENSPGPQWTRVPAVVLLLCPFCGGAGVPAKVLRDGYEGFPEDPDAYAHFIHCVSCAAQGGWRKNPAGAVTEWNRRTGQIMPILLSRSGTETGS